jgi:hypothetical protein
LYVIEQFLFLSEQIESAQLNETPRILVADTCMQVLQHKAQLYSSHAQTEWGANISDIHNVHESLDWAVYLSTYRDWLAGIGSAILHVEYEQPQEWYATLAKVVAEDLRKHGTELIWAFGDSTFTSLSNGDFKMYLGRSLLSQLIVKLPKCLIKLDDIQKEAQTHPVDTWQDPQISENGLVISWKNSLWAPNAAWQHVWSLLACALRNLSKPVVVMMIGFNGEKYQAFMEASKYLDSVFSAKARGILREDDFYSIPHRLLVLGKPNPEDFGSLGYPSSWEFYTIDEEVEIKGASSKFLVSVGIKLILSINRMLRFTLFSRAPCSKEQNRKIRKGY